MTTSTTQTEPIDIASLEHLRNLSASLDVLRQNKTLTDVFVECGTQKFPAHRLVLSAVSPYFRRAFEKASTVVLSDVSAQSMEIILNFLYRGKVQDIIGNDEDMAKLLQASHHLQIDELIRFSFNSLADRYMNSAKFFEVYSFVESLKNDYCERQIVTFLAKNFTDVVKSKDFMLLQGNAINRILQCEDLYHNQIEDVVVGILKWAEFESPREQLLENLLQVFETRCCCECLNNIVEKNLCVSWTPAVATALLTWKTSLISLKQENATKQRKLYCFGTIAEKQVIRIFDIESYTWSPYRVLSFHFELDMAVTSFDQHLYFIGGRDCLETEELNPSNKFIQYCPFSNTVVDSGQDLITPVFQAGAGILNDIIYVVNGRNAKNTPILQLVQRYNRMDCVWSLAPYTKEAHGMPYVFSFNQFLYVIGSNASNTYCMERYDPLSEQWTVTTKISGGIFYHKAAFYDAKVIVVQEYNEMEYHIYDFFSGVWLHKLFQGRPLRIKGLWMINNKGERLLLVCDDENVLHTCDVHSGNWIQPISQPKDKSCNLIYLVQN